MEAKTSCLSPKEMQELEDWLRDKPNGQAPLMDYLRHLRETKQYFTALKLIRENNGKEKDQPKPSP